MHICLRISGLIIVIIFRDEEDIARTRNYYYEYYPIINIKLICISKEAYLYTAIYLEIVVFIILQQNKYFYL